VGTIFFLVLLARSAGGPGPFGGDKPAGRSAATPAGVLCAGLRLVGNTSCRKGGFAITEVIASCIQTPLARSGGAPSPKCDSLVSSMVTTSDAPGPALVSTEYCREVAADGDCR
jgi:hypothetical protein